MRGYYKIRISSSLFFARSQYFITNPNIDTDFLEHSAMHEKTLSCIQTKNQTKDFIPMKESVKL